LLYDPPPKTNDPFLPSEIYIAPPEIYTAPIDKGCNEFFSFTCNRPSLNPIDIDSKKLNADDDTKSDYTKEKFPKILTTIFCLG
jgi:hypothetical protein